ncbi:MAG: hypothetical protein J6B26_05470 [Agathobacter sp.]|nr:hypothetical protein [Agathobacter sp.]
MGESTIIYSVMNIVLWIGMVWNGILDLWKKRISLIPVIIMLLTGISIRIWQGEIGEPWVWYGFLPGIICLLLSVLSKGEIGIGDGWMILGMGALIDYELLFGACIFGMLLAAVVAGILFIGFHKNRKYSIPFVPFLVAGYICGRCLL